VLAFLDDVPLSLDRATFAGAIEAASDSARSRGRIVSHVLLDGAPVSSALLLRPPEVPLGREVRITSAAPHTAVPPGAPAPRLGRALEALEHAADLQAQAARCIMTSRLEESLQPLAGAIQGWQSVQQIVVEEMSWAAGSEAFNSMLTDLAAKLREVHRSLEGQDWSALADALAYDMKEQADGWRMLLEGVAGGGETE
jgi:hypothetical protein